MVRISEDLIRRRAEHNEGQLSTLEEVSLHQQDIERIEYIDKWCRDLKILYLQSNLIPRIENLSRLKNLEYINLALNNIEKVENLEGCESLKKLDLTVNFVGELTSIECLCGLEHFRELYLTGNPCSQYQYYREFVIHSLPQIELLDGAAVSRSDRIKANQVSHLAREKILQQQREYLIKREKERVGERIRLEDTDGNPDHGNSGDDNDDKFWKEKVAFTPESRIEVHDQMKKQRERQNKPEENKEKRTIRLVADDGRPLNVNEGRLDFSLVEDDENNKFVLNLEIYKYLDTSLLDVDVQTSYVRATIKGKQFQLVLPEDVNPDRSCVQRSQVTGHLQISMPKANGIIKKRPKHLYNKLTKTKSENNTSGESEFLEVDSSQQVNLNLEDDKSRSVIPPLDHHRQHITERENNPDFIDDPDVPPLE